LPLLSKKKKKIMEEIEKKRQKLKILQTIQYTKVFLRVPQLRL